MVALPGEKESDKIGETELNEIILNSIPNGWSKKVYGQGFDSETIAKKKLLIGLNTWKLRK